MADRPTLFRDLNNPKNFLILPVISSEKRFYLLIGYAKSGEIVTNAVKIIPNADLYLFGILTSSVHYGFDENFSEEEIVSELMNLYKTLTIKNSFKNFLSKSSVTVEGI